MKSKWNRMRNVFERRENRTLNPAFHDSVSGFLKYWRRFCLSKLKNGWTLVQVARWLRCLKMRAFQGRAVRLGALVLTCAGVLTDTHTALRRFIGVGAVRGKKFIIKWKLQAWLLRRLHRHVGDFSIFMLTSRVEPPVNSSLVRYVPLPLACCLVKPAEVSLLYKQEPEWCSSAPSGTHVSVDVDLFVQGCVCVCARLLMLSVSMCVSLFI